MPLGRGQSAADASRLTKKDKPRAPDLLFAAVETPTTTMHDPP